jgi:hypothetical protein
MKRPFDELNAADERMEVSPHIETRLRAEVRLLATRRLSSGLKSRGTTLAIAASLALVIGASAWLLRNTERPNTQPSPVAMETAAESLTDFVPLGYNRIPAGSTTHIVRLEVPRNALASFGLLPMDKTAASNDDTVLADVIVGDDGLARAVRFVRSTSH